MNRKNKILFVITQGGPWGGAQRYVFDLASALSTDYDVTVAIGEPTGVQHLQDQLQNITLIQLQHLRRAVHPLHDVFAIKELSNVYKKIQPDIVHLNSSKAGIIGSFARMITSVPVLLYTVHGWVFEERISSYKRICYRWLESTTARFKDALLFVSEKDRHTAQTLGIDADKLQVIPLGISPIDYYTREEARDHFRHILHHPLDDQKTWYGCIANLYPTKGVDTLIEAIAAMHNPHLICIIIGDGEQREHLEGLVKKHHLSEQVFFAGFQNTAARYTKAFDCMVIPSRKEGLPYALLEICQAGIPVIASDVGGIAWILHDRTNGMLVPSEDIAALKEAMRFADQHPIDMTQMGAKAAETVASFTTETMTSQTIALYLRLLESTKQSK